MFRSLALVQSNVLSVAQLRVCGFDHARIHRWVAAGRLWRVHRGAYSLAPRLSDEGRLWAAQLAVDGIFDAETSAWVWGVVAPHPDPIRLLAKTRRRSREGLLVRVADPLPDAVVLRQRATANAAFAGLLPRNTDATETPLEDLLMNRVQEAGVVEPARQRLVGGARVDFVWPALRLIIETDGHRAHDNPHAFHADRRRDAEALAAGWRTVRFTRRQLEEEPEYVVSILRQLVPAAVAR